MKTRIAICVGVVVLGAASLLTGTRADQPPNSSFTVFDSSGRPVGPVIGTMQGTRITIAAISFHNKWLPVEVLRNSFQVGGSFYYQSTDCSGQAFLDPSSSPFPATAVFGPTSELFYENGPSQNISVQSLQDQTSGTCSSTSFSFNAVPVNPAFSLKVFNPPFKVVSN